MFHDTAGLRTAPGSVEKKGIDRTWKMLATADLVLHLDEAAAIIDGSAPQKLRVPVPPNEAQSGQEFSGTVIRVGTKSDLVDQRAAADSVVMTSSVIGTGIDELWRTIDAAVDEFRLREAANQGVVLNQRHLHKLSRCREELTRLIDDMETTKPGPEVIGTLLSGIVAHLGEISGRVFSEQVLAAVFSRFCVGK